MQTSRKKPAEKDGNSSLVDLLGVEEETQSSLIKSEQLHVLKAKYKAEFKYKTEIIRKKSVVPCILNMHCN